MVQKIMSVLIRPETSTDVIAIEQVTIAAFTGKPYSNQTEHLIVNALRASDALSLSLVAEMNEEIIGHIAFSKVAIDDRDLNWYGIGPVSVSPSNQKQGVGTKLIREGMITIHKLGALGCVLEGSPNYYQRFGFKSYEGLIYKGAPAPEYFMAFPFTDEIPQGKVEFHKSFYIHA
ncbi:MAG: N-acetyltransferase [Anaerolineales bacterium]